MNDHEQQDRYLAPQAAADYAKMSLSWLRKRTAAGEVPHIKLGRRVVYDRLDLDAYMDEQKKRTAWKKRDDRRRA
jgi:predicted DNA-binding transcriptional regulator AlpA